MSRKAKRAKAAEVAAKGGPTAVVAKPVEPPPPPEPKPLGKKATLIAAKKAGKQRSSRLAVTREKAPERPEANETVTAWANQDRNQSATKSMLGRLMTGQIAPKYKPTIGQDPIV